MSDAILGQIISVDTQPAGTTTNVAATTGDTLLLVGDVYDFDPSGGTLKIGETVLAYESVIDIDEESDDESATILLIDPLPDDITEETLVLVEPYAETKIAMLDMSDEGDALEVTVPHALVALLNDGLREPDAMETVRIEETVPGEWAMTDVLDQPAVITADTLNPSQSDGLPPEVSPDPTVVSGVRSVFTRWDPVTNMSLVTYEVHLSTTPDFAIGDAIQPDPVVADIGLDNLGFEGTNAQAQAVCTVGTPSSVTADATTFHTGAKALKWDPAPSANMNLVVNPKVVSQSTTYIPSTDGAHTFSVWARTGAGTLAQGAHTFKLKLRSYDSTGLLLDETVYTAAGSIPITIGWVLHTVTSPQVPGTSFVQPIIEAALTTDLNNASFFFDDMDLERVYTPPMVGGATLVGVTTGSSFTVRTDALGQDLVNDQDYYIRIVATDIDGAAEPSDDVGPTQTMQITGPDIAANYVYAGVITADQIIGGDISSDLLLSGTIKTATAGARVEVGADGIVIYGPDGTPTTVLGSNDQSSFSGDVVASSLAVNDNFEMRGVNNELARAARLFLANSITPASSAPTTVVDWESIPLSGGGFTPSMARSLSYVNSQWVIGCLVNSSRYCTFRFNPDGTFASTGSSDVGGETASGSTQIASSGFVYTMASNNTLYRHRKVDSAGVETSLMTDDFSTDLSQWPESYGTRSIDAGRAKLVSSPGVYSGISTTSTGSFGLRGRVITAQVTRSGTMRASHEFYMWAGIDDSDQALMNVGSDGQLTMSYVKGGVVSKTSIAYNPTSMAWWQIYEFNGVLYFRTSPDGVAFTQQRRLTHTYTVAQLNSFKAEMGVGDYSSTLTTVYSQKFDTITTDGWTNPSSTVQTSAYGFPGGTSPLWAHTGSYSMSVSGGTDGSTVRTVTGLTAGKAYTLSAWVATNSTGRQASVGVTGIGNGTAITAPNSTAAQQVTYTFTATATSHELRLNGNYLGWDDILLATPENLTVYIDNFRWYDCAGSVPYTYSINTAQVPAIGNDGTDLLIGEYRVSDGKFIIRTIDVNDLKTIKSTVITSAVAGFKGPVSSVLKGSFDFGATRYVVKELGSNNAWVFDSAGVHQPNDSFPADDGGSRGLAWDGTFFWSLGTNGRLYRHTSLSWSDAGATAPWRAGYTWYDADTTGGTHQTTLSPTAAFTMKKRARLTVTSLPIPDDGTSDSPDSIKVYVGKSSGSMYLQTSPAVGVRSIAYIAGIVFSGTTAPTTNNFPGATPASIRSANEDLIISGDGTIRAKQYLGLLGGTEALAQPYLAVMDTLKSNISGGGVLTNTGVGVGWSARIMLMGAGKHSSYIPAGYFVIDMPPNGTVIPVYSSATTSVTVASGLIPMQSWFTLYYEVPFGSTSTSKPENFRIVHYNAGTDFVVPWNWIPIVVWNIDDTDTFKWCTGIIQSDWTAMTLNAAFKNYDSTTPPVAKLVNGMVTVNGALSPNNATGTSQINGTAGTTPFFTLPVGMRSSAPYNMTFVQQGSGTDRWSMIVQPNGNVYGTRYSGTPSTTTWLPISGSWPI